MWNNSHSFEEHSLFVVSGASGTGKTSVICHLLNSAPHIRPSVSFTTRKPRSTETHGEDYFFISEEEFEKMRKKGEFLEWASVHGNLYGTSAEQLERTRKKHDVILEIDCQGARQIREKMEEVTTIFILPPSWPILEKRLKQRGTESDESINQRLANAKEEMLQANAFDYVIINSELGQASTDLESIVSSTKLQFKRQKGFVATILNDLK